MRTHSLWRGTTPLIISVPHAGTALPEDLVPQLTPLAQTLADTDWNVAQLYDFAPALGATVIAAHYSRYLIDLNRPLDDAALYSAAPQTGLCPTLSFSGDPLYRDRPGGLTPTEVTRRRQLYWQPYHDELRALLAAARAHFGYALLLDAHSICSTVPRLFAGRLPDINIGTHQGQSCSPVIHTALAQQLDLTAPGSNAATQWTHVFNGRFTGGYITRHYGQPKDGVHALQIELAQCAYMDETVVTGEASETRPTFDALRAAPLQELLRRIVEALLSVPLKGA